MKEAFKNCMRHLYPSGVSDPGQLTDLMRTFSMGWVEAHDAIGAEVAEDVLAVCKQMTSPDFRPDRSWRWW